MLAVLVLAGSGQTAGTGSGENLMAGAAWSPIGEGSMETQDSRLQLYRVARRLSASGGSNADSEQGAPLVSLYVLVYWRRYVAAAAGSLCFIRCSRGRCVYYFVQEMSLVFKVIALSPYLR